MRGSAQTLVATFVAVGGLVIAAGANAQTTVGGCLLPSQAAIAFSDDWSLDFPDTMAMKDCKSQCKQLEKGCMSVASAGNQCTASASKAFAASEDAFCRTIENKSDRKSCQQEVKNGTKAQNQLLKQNRKNAKAFCKEERQGCDAFCEGVL